MMGKALSGAVLVLFFGFLIFGMNYGIYRLLSAQGLYSIRAIDVKDNRFLTKDQIITASGLEKGLNLFELSIQDAAVNVGTNVFIEYAEVKRMGPGRIEISVKERKPAAVLTDSRQYWICSADGRIMMDGTSSNLPMVMLDYPETSENGLVQDDFVIMLLKNLAAFPDNDKIRKIFVKRKEGVFMTLSGMEDTLFFLGNVIPDNSVFNKAIGISDKMKSQNMKIKWIDINKENAIGFKS